MKRKYALLFLLIVMTILSILFQDKHTIKQAEVMDGTVSIPKFDETTMVYQLNGDWHFYWKELLNPNSQSDQYQTIPVPSSWTVNEQNEPKGYGTYRMQFDIANEDIHKEHAIYLRYISSAYKVYVNGELLATNGKIGITEDTEVPYLRHHFLSFKPKKENELLIQVSNHSFRESGVFEHIIYGEYDNVLSYMLKILVEKLLLMGGFLFTGIYYFLMYMINRYDRTFLYISLISILMMIRTFLLTENVFHLLFPTVEWQTMVKVTYIVEIVCALLFIQLMYNLYQKRVKKFVYWLAMTLLLCLLCFVLLTKPFTFTSYFWLIVIVVTVVILYFSTIVSIRAILNKVEGSYINATGILIVIIASIVDKVLDVAYIPSLLPYSGLLFIILQGVIVSKRYNLLAEQNQELAYSLTQLNNTLEQKVSERTEELQKKNKLLMNLQKSRADMLENIAHDIGSPINAFEKQFVLMKQGYIEPSTSLYDTLIQKTNQIKRLANDLFELSNLQSKKWSIQKETVQVSHFIEEVATLFRLELNQYGMILRLDYHDIDHMFIHVDKVRIIQVLRNFVDNAVKHGKETKTIEINAVRTEADCLRIEVRDYGIGIEKEELEHIFERFYRISTKMKSGSGLGLAIAKEIIEQHNGEIGVRSELGDGSTFYFILPIIKAHGHY
jgi:signal transduction histidine kinase